ncbi:PDZ domain-containing protein [Alloscardovia venturai]|uniref:endopeptidase La n=1 Tax=Alloscardovia venturai TaxID=1769421 RepID=A0ABW2Y9F1_9BIFI
MVYRSGKMPSHLKRRKLAIVAIAMMIIMLLLPSPYAVEMPGPTQDVLGTVSSTSKISMIDVSGVRTYRNSGELHMVSVSATGVPGYYTPTAVALWAWFNPHMAVLPQEAVYSINQSASDYDEEGDQQMTTAQDTASVVAKKYLKDTLGINADRATVTMHIDDIGGPSAGMMYTLGTISKLTPTDEVRGKIIAGTGTISRDGKVGAIGGIQLKMIGARRDDARYFLAPQSNCSEVVGHIPQGLKVYAVSNIDQAYKALVAIGQGRTSGLQPCSASSVKNTANSSTHTAH